MLVLAAVFILMSTMVFSVSALREPVIQFFIEVYEKFSTVLFHSHEDALVPPTALEIIYEPAWLPEGYAAQDEMTVMTDVLQIRYYTNGNEVFVFRQYVAGSGVNIDTEGTEIQRSTIHRHEAILYQNKSTWTIVWNDGRYAYTISGLANESDMIRVAESLKIK
jgi:hypothetical protein